MYTLSRKVKLVKLELCILHVQQFSFETLVEKVCILIILICTSIFRSLCTFYAPKDLYSFDNNNVEQRFANFSNQVCRGLHFEQGCHGEPRLSHVISYGRTYARVSLTYSQDVYSQRSRSDNFLFKGICTVSPRKTMDKLYVFVCIFYYSICCRVCV